MLESPAITADDIAWKSAGDIRALARRLRLQPDPDRPDRFMDPVTGRERLRIDQGHVDPLTGSPYRNPRAAVPHVHAYPPEGPRAGKVLDRTTGDAHFPLGSADGDKGECG